MKKGLFLSFTVINLSFSCFAQQLPSLIWAENTGINGYSNGRAITNDSKGNILITGEFSGEVDFDPSADTFNLISSANGDIFVQKLNSNGDLIWVKQFTGTGKSSGYSITVDSADFICVTGFFLNTVDFDPSPSTFNLSANGSSDVFILKLDAAGNLVWAKKIGGPGTDFGYGIAVDSSSNVYITGTFASTADFDPDSGSCNLTSRGMVDIFIEKLDKSGNFVWAEQIGDTGTDHSHGIVVLNSGVYITGYFGGTVDFNPGTETYFLTATGIRDVFVEKLDTAGRFIWAKSMASTDQAWGNSIAVDKAGNVYTTGTFSGNLNVSQSLQFSSIGFDVFIQKLDSNGNLLWAKSMGGQGMDIGISLAVDALGNSYSTGLSEGSTGDIFIQKLDSLGNLLWVKIVGSNDDLSNGIAIDLSGNIYTTGYFRGVGNFSPGPDTFYLVSNQDYNMVVTKWGQNTANIINHINIHQSFSVKMVSLNSFKYVLTEKGFVTVKYFDLRGRFISSIINQMQIPGTYEFTVPSECLAKGIYFLVFKEQMNNSRYENVSRILNIN